jgi:uncharacterized membrane protein YphA (DoxX/SURF4 family)
VKFSVSPAVRGWTGLVVRLVLAAVFVWAAWSKLGDPRTFVRAVRAYDATPEWLSKGIGYGLPVLEVTLAVLLLLGLITRYAAVVVAVLLVVFIAGIVQAGTRGIKLACAVPDCLAVDQAVRRRGHYQVRDGSRPVDQAGQE